jgi:hypothetical protein
LTGLHTQLQAAMVPHIKGAWSLAVGTDLRYAGSSINEPFNSSFVEKAAGAYVQELFGLAASDPVVSKMCCRVGMLKEQAIRCPAAFERHAGPCMCWQPTGHCHELPPTHSPTM